MYARNCSKFDRNFKTHHTENRLRGKAGGGGGCARWLLSTDSLLRAWTAFGTALNGSCDALLIIPGGRLPFPTVSLKLLAPPPMLPPPWKLFHLLTGPLLATWCPLPGPLGPRSWLVCLCILSCSRVLPSLSQPSVIPHDSDVSSFASILFLPPTTLFSIFLSLFIILSSVSDALDDYILQDLPTFLFLFNFFPSVVFPVKFGRRVFSQIANPLGRVFFLFFFESFYLN